MAYDYSKYDYDALVEEVTRIVKESDILTETYQSSTTQVLIQLIAAITDQLHYMLERRVEESYLPTAKLESSVRSLANAMGYKPRRKVSARGNLSLSVVDEDGNLIQPSGNIVIPKNSLITYDGISFTNIEEISYNSSRLEPLEFEIKEGVVQTLDYDMNDVASTLYQYGYIDIKDYTFIENGSLTVYTDTQEFVDVTVGYNGNPPLFSLGFAGESDAVYDIRYTNSGMRIVFGDGVHGQKPVGTLYIRYIRSSGTDVNVSSSNLPFAFESDVLTVGVNEYEYILVNTTPITSASEEESIESIKRLAPNYIRTASRAVTGDDYSFYVKQSGIGNIVDVSAYGEQETGITVYNMNNVYISYLRGDNGELTQQEKINLRAWMDQYKTITTNLVFIPAETILAQLTLKIRRDSRLTASDQEVFDKIVLRLKELLDSREGALGQDIYYSDIVRELDSFTIRKNNYDYTVARWVDLDIKALKPFSFPNTTQQQVATVKTAFSTNVYALTIDGNDYSYTAVPSDTTTSIASSLAGLINNEFEETYTVSGSSQSVFTTVQEYIVGGESLFVYVDDVLRDVDDFYAETDENTVTFVNPVNIGSVVKFVIRRYKAEQENATITINTLNVGTPFEITSLSSTNPFDMEVLQAIQLPDYEPANTSYNKIVPGSIEILNNVGVPLASDDSNGNIVVPGVDNVQDSIVYSRGLINLPTIFSNGDYYIRYQHDKSQNLYCNNKNAVILQPFDGTTTLPDLSTNSINSRLRIEN